MSNAFIQSHSAGGLRFMLFQITNASGTEVLRVGPGVVVVGVAHAWTSAVSPDNPKIFHDIESGTVTMSSISASSTGKVVVTTT